MTERELTPVVRDLAHGKLDELLDLYAAGEPLWLMGHVSFSRVGPTMVDGYDTTIQFVVKETL